MHVLFWYTFGIISSICSLSPFCPQLLLFAQLCFLGTTLIFTRSFSPHQTKRAATPTPLQFTTTLQNHHNSLSHSPPHAPPQLNTTLQHHYNSPPPHFNDITTHHHTSSPLQLTTTLYLHTTRTTITTLHLHSSPPLFTSTPPLTTTPFSGA